MGRTVAALLMIAARPAFGAAAVPQALSLGGQLFDSTGAPLTAPHVNFQIRVYDAAESCVLYSENQLAVDLSQTQGRFSLVLGGGSSRVNNLDGGTTLDAAVFNNVGIVPVANCSATTVALQPGDPRMLRILYDIGGGPVALTPDVPMVAAGSAMIADSVQGKGAADFVQIANNGSTALTQTNAAYAFSAVNWPRLKALLDGTSTQYFETSPTAPLDMNAQRITDLADPTAAQDAVTKAYADRTLAGKPVDVTAIGPMLGNNDALLWDSTAQKWVAGPIMVTPTGSAGGDLTGTYPNPQIANNAVNSNKISTTGGGANRLLITNAGAGDTVGFGTCALNQVYAWTVSGWACTNVAALAPVTSVAGRTGAITLNAGDIAGLGSAALYDQGTGANQIPRLDSLARMPAVDGSQLLNINATALQSYPVSPVAPVGGQYLSWNSATSQWTPAAVAGGSVTQVNTGNGLLGGPFTVSGTITADVGTSANKLVQLNSAAQSALAAGSAAAPTYSFVGNTGAGVYAPGLNQLAFVTGGTAALSIGPTGLIGIGTAIPQGGLDVALTGPAGSALIVPRDAVTNRPTTPVNGMIRYASDTSRFEVYQNGAWQNMLGGSASSVALSGLTAATAVNSIDSLNFPQTWNWSTVTSQASLLLNAPGLTTGSLLTLQSSSNALGSTNGLFSVANTGTATSGLLAKFQSNATPGAGLYVLANGNVGLGTTAPLFPLDVGSPTMTSSAIFRRTASSTNISAGPPGVVLQNQSVTTGNFSSLSFIDANGYNQGGIGLVYGPHTAANQGSIYIEPTNSGASPRSFVVSGTGNVGVGTATPQSGLDVATLGASSALIVPRDQVANRPSAPVNGMIRYASDTSRFEVYQSGSWQNMLGGASSNTPLSGLTAATAVNAIDNLNLAQTWAWSTATTHAPLTTTANGLTTGSIFTVSTSSPALNSINGLLNITNSGTSTSGVVARVQSNSALGSGLTVLANGNVGVGTAAPQAGLDVATVGQQGSAIIIPRDSTINRPPTPVNGMLRYNTSVNAMEGYFNGVWSTISAGSTAGTVLNLSTGTGLLGGPITTTGTISANVGTGAFQIVQENSGAQIAQASGSAAAPSFTFVGNTSTGLFSPAANQLALATNGSSALTILGNGNVGLGTTAPLAALDIAGLGTTASAVIVPRDSVANRPATPVNGMIRYASDTSKFEVYQSGAWQNMLGGSASSVSLSGLTAATAVNSIDSLNFAQAWNWSTATSQTSLAITSNGLTSGSAFSVTSSSPALNSTVGLLNVANTGTSTNGVVASIQSNGSAASGLYVFANGYVGIGTSAPLTFAKFGVHDSTSALISANQPGVNTVTIGAPAGIATNFSYQGANEGVVYSYAKMNLGVRSNANLAMGTNNLERMTITGAGNVGIGTNNPLGGLDVALTGTISSAVIVPRDTVANRPATPVNGMIRYASDTSKFEVYQSGAWQNMLGGMASSLPLSGLTAATATNSIDSLNFAQTWNWSTATSQTTLTGSANALTSGSLLGLISASPALNSANGLLYVANTGTATSGLVARLQSNGSSGSGLSVLASGSVGIGTSNPQSGLHVFGSTTTSATSSVQGLGDVYPQITLSRTAGSTFTNHSWATFIDGSGWLGFKDVTAGTMPLIVDTAGRVGINALSPQNRLDVGGSVALGGYAGTAAPSNGLIVSGNLGIGTSVPLAALDISTTGSVASSIIVPRDTVANRPAAPVNGMIRYASDTSRFEVYQSGAWQNMLGGSASSMPLSGITAATAANAIDSLNFPQAWNWSTATTQSAQSNSANALTSGSILALTSTSASLNSTNGLLSVVNAGTSTAGMLASITSSNVAGSGLTVLANGYVGVGTNVPTAPLQVAGDIRVTGAIYPLSGSNAILPANNQIDPLGLGIRAGDSVNITVDTDNSGVGAFGVRKGNLSPAVATTLFYVANGGNVGIGTNAPQSGLDIAVTGTTASSMIVPRDTVANRPTTPVNGMIRYASDTARFEAYQNGTWQTMIGGSASSMPLSGITAATAANTIDSLNFPQAWNWSTATTQSAQSKSANALTTGSILALTSSSNALNSTGGLLNVANTGTSTSGVLTRLQANATAGSGLTLLANGNLGVGTAAPASILNLSTSGTAGLIMDAYGGNAAVIGRASRGTIAAPTASQTDDALSWFAGRGYGATGFGASGAGGMYVKAAEPFTDTAQGGYITFETNPTGSTTRVERVRIAASGNVGIGGVPQAGLDVNTVGSGASAIIVPRDSVANRPATPVNGMIRYASDTSRFEVYQSGSWQNMLGGAASSLPLSGITAATAANTIDSLNFPQTWNWSTATTQTLLGINGNGLTNGTGLAVQSSNPSLASTNGLLNVANTGTSTNGVVARVQSNSAAGSGLTVLANGNVGVGTTAPAATLNTALTSSALSGAILGEQTALTVTPSGSTSASFTGFNSNVQVSSANGIGLTQGISSIVGNTNSGTSTNIYAIYTNAVQSHAAGTVGQLTGTYNDTANLAGAVSNMSGTVNYLRNANSYTVSSAFGSSNQIRNVTGGTINTAYGDYNYIFNTGTGTIGNAYGAFVASPTNTGGGAITNFYGVYVQTPTAAGTNYAIYSQGGTNYFGGNVGVGTVSPQAALDVNVTGTVASAVIVPRDTTANRPATPVNGMIRYASDTASFEGFQNGTWQNLIGTAATSLPLSGLTAATANNTIDSQTFAQTWNWSTATTQALLTSNANALTTGSMLSLNTSNPSLNSTNGLLSVGYSGTSTNGLVARIQANGTAGSGLYVLANGRVGIGTNGPAGPLDVEGGTALANQAGQPIKIIGQNGGTGGNLAGGGITITSGVANGSAVSGPINIAGGGGTVGGAVNINGGGGSNGAGAVTIAGGSPTGGNFTGAALQMSGGAGAGTAVGGAASLAGGAAGAVGTGGTLTLSSGAGGTSTGNSGNIVLMPGAVTSGVLGNVGINTTTPQAGLDIATTGTISSAVIVPRDTVANRPATPVNGMIRYASDTARFEAYQSGSWQPMIGGAASSLPLSGITAATAVNSIDSLNFAQIWNWSTATTQSAQTMTANALTTGSLLNLTTSSPSLNSANGLLNVANTGTSTAGVVTRIQSNSTNAASGLTVLANGNVGVGSSAPAATLDVQGGTANSNTNGLPIRLAGQAAGTGGNNSGGAITLTGGIGNGSGASGGISLTGGSGFAGGPIAIVGGNGSSGAPGSVSVLAGNGSASNVVGGTAQFGAGAGSGSAAGGGVSLTGGNGGSSGPGGSVTIASGNGGTSSGNSGNIVLMPGSVTSGVTGNVGINTASPAGGLDIAMTGTISSAVIVPRDTVGNRPGIPVNGMIRYASDTSKLEAYQNGTWQTMIGGSASSLPLSGLTAATAVNSIDSLNFAQTWTWSTATSQSAQTNIANALTTGSLLNLTTSSASLNSTAGLLNVANTGTSLSGVIARVQSNGTAGSGLTVLANGSVGVGSSSPQYLFDTYNSAGQARAAVHNSNTTATAEIDLIANDQAGANASGFYVGVGATGGGFGAFLNMYNDRNLDLMTQNSIRLRVASGSNGGGVAIGSYAASSTPPASGLIVSGLAGIGTATPGAALDIYATGTTSSAIIVPRDTVANRPSTAVNGMIRYASDTARFEAYQNGAWQSMIGGSASSTPLSGLTAATAVNTIDSLNFAQTWNWSTATSQTAQTKTANALTTGSLLTLTSSSPSLSSTGGLLNVANMGTSTSGVIARIQANSTAPASGLTVLANGNVGINSTAPTVTLQTGSANLNNILTVGAFGAGINYNGNDVFSVYGNPGSGHNVMQIQTGNASSSGYLLKFINSTSTTLGFVDNLGNQYVAGNSGIATMTPQAALDVAAVGTANSAIIVPRDTVANRPTAPVNGMIRYASDTARFEAYQSGTWQTMIGGSASSLPLSGITAATAVNSIDSLNFAQTWNWSTATSQNAQTQTANALTTGSLLNLTTSSASFNSTGGLLNVANTGTSQSGLIARIQSNGTAGSGLTVLANGNVGIGTASPNRALTVLTPTGSGFSVQNNLGTQDAVILSSDASNGYLTLNNGGTAYARLAATGVNYMSGSLSVGALTNPSTNTLNVVGAAAFGAFGNTVTAPSNGLVVSGRVGVGTATPAAGLDVFGTGTTNSALIVPRDTVANRPNAPVNGMIRYASDTSTFEAYQNGTWQTMIGGAASTLPLSGITAATAANSIDSLNFAQTWNWSTANTQAAQTKTANALTTGSVLSLNSSSSSLNSTGGLLNVANTGTSTAGSVMKVQSNSTSGSGLTVLANNFVGIATNAPTTLFQVGSAGGTLNWNSPLSGGADGILQVNYAGAERIGLASNGGAFWAGLPGRAGIRFQGGVGGYIFAGPLDGSLLINPTGGNLGIGTTAALGGLDVSLTGTVSSAIIVPRDTVANRPTTPVNGMIRYASDTAKLEAYQNGTWQTMIGGSASSLPLSGITAATAVNSIDSLNFAQTWNWSTATTQSALNAYANAMTTGSLLNLNSSSSSLNSTNGILSVANTGTSTAGLVARVQSNASAAGSGLSVLASGNVGIGTTAPTAALQVTAGAASGPGAQILLSSPLNNAAASVLYSLATSNKQVDLGLGAPNGFGNLTNKFYLNDSVGGVRWVTDITNGNFGIGTQTPQSKLDVAGGVSVGTYAGVNAAPSNGMIVSGNVGIGTNSPAAGLDVATTGTVASALIVPRDTVANRPSTPVNGMIRYASDTAKIEAYQNGAWQPMIGTATNVPLSGLTAATASNSIDNLNFPQTWNWSTATSQNVDTRMGNALTTGSVMALSSTSSSLNSTNGLLSVINAGTSTAGLVASFQAPSGNGLFVQNAGNVGVNTAAPAANLDVVGSAQVSGNVLLKASASQISSWSSSIVTVLPTAANTNGAFFVTPSGSATSSAIGVSASPNYGASNNTSLTQSGANATILNNGSGNLSLGTNGGQQVSILNSGLRVQMPSGSGYGFVMTGNPGLGAGGYMNLALNNTTSGAYKSSVEFQSNGSPKFSFGVDYTGNASNNFSLFDNVAGTIRMFIDPSGRVGINTSSPGYMLDVQGGDINTSGCVHTGGSSAFGTCTSDERLKEDVQSFDYGLNELLGLQPRTFRYNGLGEQPVSEHPSLGVIAQEVEKTAPGLVSTRDVRLHPTDASTTTVKQVNYTAFTYVLINAVKELYARWTKDSAELHQAQDAARARLDQLAADNERLRRENAEIKARLDRVEATVARPRKVRSR